jgi:hypothetical protein
MSACDRTSKESTVTNSDNIEDLLSQLKQNGAVVLQSKPHSPYTRLGVSELDGKIRDILKRNRAEIHDVDVNDGQIQLDVLCPPPFLPADVTTIRESGSNTKFITITSALNDYSGISPEDTVNVGVRDGEIRLTQTDAPDYKATGHPIDGYEPKGKLEYQKIYEALSETGFQVEGIETKGNTAEIELVAKKANIDILKSIINKDFISYNCIKSFSSQMLFNIQVFPTFNTVDNRYNQTERSFIDNQNNSYTITLTDALDKSEMVGEKDICTFTRSGEIRIVPTIK